MLVGPGESRQRLTAILAADVAGYTRLMAADAGATVAALDEARAHVRREIEAHAGRVVDMAGDSVLALFDSAAGAVQAALAVQKALEGRSAGMPDERRMRMRIGVHLGDVIERPDGTIYGHGVNVAARLQGEAAPGGICLSETLYESVKGSVALVARYAGRRRLKNIDQPVALWQLVPEGTRAEDDAPAATPNNLPLQLTSFIGREGEIAEAAKLLARSRLLTLVGVGGIGKTRLSREPLRIAGETTYGVPALPENAAVRLFTDRAAAVTPNFRVNGHAAALASICRRLDGIPLAIELAAARVRSLPIDAIAKRLDDRFRLLTGGDRTALPRQQTLRALIDWSYELLSDAERAVFRRLAVFAGGWTLEAAEAVAGFGELHKASVLEQLSGLTEKSLVVLEADRARYRLLDTVRQYAQERLAEAAESDDTRNRD